MFKKKPKKKDLSLRVLKDNGKGSDIDSLNEQILFLERHVEDLRQEVEVQYKKIESCRSDFYKVFKPFSDLFKMMQKLSDDKNI